MFCGQSFVNGGPPKDLPYRELASFALLPLIRCLLPGSSLATVARIRTEWKLCFFTAVFLATATVLVVLHPAMPKASTSSKPKTQSSKPRKAAAPPSYHVRFANVSNDEAAQGSKKVSQRENTTIPARSSASDIQLRELWTRRLLCAHCCSTGKCKRKRKLTGIRVQLWHESPADAVSAFFKDKNGTTLACILAARGGGLKMNGPYPGGQERTLEHHPCSLRSEENYDGLNESLIL
ncbi:hypothetical protein R3P38DRAFT_3214047 [Favolaschia claudopus]|uniref:Uncharacterized protein n=1 Tax=Favolaschia claudopus TaxID=2862362 RepID=A0AAW0ADG4_9AGAR